MKKNFVQNLLFFAILLLSHQMNAQFSCETAVPITDGYTAFGITTPGNGGPEDWVTSVTTCDENSSYWTSDDNYLFSYTTGSEAGENVSMTILSRNTWNGIMIFTDCSGTVLDGCLDDEADSGSGSRTVSVENLGANQTIYICLGQWGAPDDLDFDVTEFSAGIPACANTPVFTVAQGSNNCPMDEFFIDVIITDLGDAAGVDISANGMDFEDNVTADTYPIGPFPTGTVVTVTVSDDANVDCNDSAEITTTVCPPANDECDAAIELTVNSDFNCGTVTPGTTVGATASAQTDDVTGTPNTDVWYSFVATDEAHRVSLINVVNQGGGTSTSTDMGMGVYDGTGGCMALVFFDDSDPNTLNMTGMTIGNTYIVRVYGWSSDIQYNNFDICVGTNPPPPPIPANDECDAAIALTVNPDYSCGTVTPGTTAGATASAQEDDVTGTPNTDVWYSFVATNDVHRISLTNVVNQGNGTSTSTDMGMGVYDGTGGCMALVFFDDSDPNTLSMTGMTIGNTYIVRVYGWSSDIQYNNFDICVGTPPPPPANDLCIDAVPLTCSTIPGTTFGASGSSSTSCTGSIANHVWYSFTGDGNDYDLSVLGLNGFSVQIDVYESSDGTCDNITCNAASVDPLGTNPATTTLATVDGTVYYIAIGYWASGSTEGDFEITLICPTMPPANDLCGDAENISTQAVNGGVVMGTTVGATATDAPNDCTASPLAEGVWYFVNWGGDATNISIMSDNATTVMHVYEGGACNLVGCAANATGQGTSEITWNTAGNAPEFGGTLYSVYVSGAPRDFTLTVSNTPPLPIVLTQFSAKEDGKVNLIVWTTESELNVQSYIVERSFNGRTAWEKVGTVTAAGNSTTELNYNLVDSKPTAIAYYRLVSVDFNGATTTSDVVLVERKGDISIQVYPIPAQEQVSVDFNGNDGEKVVIYITDVAGRIVQQVQLDTFDGLNNTTIDIHNLSSGIYFLTLNNGISQVTDRIVKQ